MENCFALLNSAAEKHVDTGMKSGEIVELPLVQAIIRREHLFNKVEDRAAKALVAVKMDYYVGLL